ncbi:tyrosine-type recombinase/integrase [Amycolatopsis australiensis]|uniref:tyrosine-type recombinase/integrase n=1 Tax=Amycolatopsis australiensis TaxID=546364 RepID=UPI0009305B2D|nr:tyrosine-type recombinase/integrase [Amycolatopsis australiensis]
MDILKRRRAEAETRWVFPSATGTLRDPDNTRARFRMVVEKAPYKGLHPHDFRHYVAGVLDDAGLTAREIADYLGHERISTTQEDYMERGVVGEDVGPALERPTIELPKDEG